MKDYAYTSGERQTALSYQEIRRDHRVRYELAARKVAAWGVGGPDRFGLDLFCGNGYGTGYLGEETHTPMLGIDGSPEAIAVGEEHFSSPSTFFVHKLFPFTLPQARFDFITSFESIEHVPDGPALVAALSQALRPRGFFFASVPNQDQLPLTDTHNRFHFRHFTQAEVTEMLDAAGIEILEKYGQDTYAMRNGRMTSVLPEAAMDLRSDYDGQFLVFIGRKRD
ncbi:bifunctional 2-polyprenyl-6-hydroxyphenol methylase/3-demethylubiquinol 3-O-methyltransferase UbiG [Telmatospirillum sp. J64-1]|uniref:class I SAM-dependent methyltransferase n=1 Tax=Telmatospirillum sp. J64-1 TaxID=2502183 RepID=UPI00115CA449|nr:class I SAM-dependent methyltransferase [Telmatospirillum sp. J64-1]